MVFNSMVLVTYLRQKNNGNCIAISYFLFPYLISVIALCDCCTPFQITTKLFCFAEGVVFFRTPILYVMSFEEHFIFLIFSVYF